MVKYLVLRSHLDSWYRTKVKLKKPWEIWELRVESSRCFHPILGRSYIFFRANCCGQQSIKGEEWKFITGLQECHRALFRGGGGEGSCKAYIDTAKICVIWSEFSLMAVEIFTSRRKKKYHCVGRYNTFTCYLQLSRKPRPCSNQCVKTNWKPQETKQHHSTERDRNGNQLEALSSCNLRKKEKQMTNVALLPS